MFAKNSGMSWQQTIVISPLSLNRPSPDVLRRSWAAENELLQPASAAAAAVFLLREGEFLGHFPLPLAASILSPTLSTSSLLRNNVGL